MKVRWLAEAKAELEEAALYYGNIDGDLGERFVTKVDPIFRDIALAKFPVLT